MKSSTLLSIFLISLLLENSLFPKVYLNLPTFNLPYFQTIQYQTPQFLFSKYYLTQNLNQQRTTIHEPQATNNACPPSAGTQPVRLRRKQQTSIHKPQFPSINSYNHALRCFSDFEFYAMVLRFSFYIFRSSESRATIYELCLSAGVYPPLAGRKKTSDTATGNQRLVP